MLIFILCRLNISILCQKRDYNKLYSTDVHKNPALRQNLFQLQRLQLPQVLQQTIQFKLQTIRGTEVITNQPRQQL